MDNLIKQWIEFKMLDLHFNRLADIALTEKENVDENMDLIDHNDVNVTGSSSKEVILGNEQLST